MKSLPESIGPWGEVSNWNWSYYFKYIQFTLIFLKFYWTVMYLEILWGHLYIQPPVLDPFLRARVVSRSVMVSMCLYHKVIIWFQLFWNVSISFPTASYRLVHSSFTVPVPVQLMVKSTSWHLQTDLCVLNFCWCSLAWSVESISISNDFRF
jgi:hypothetical protein